MKNLGLRVRLLLFFIGISCIVWLVSGAVSLRESREKVDGFFDQYQMLLARQLASADWSKAVPGAQKSTNRIIDKVRGADEEDEAIGFAVFDAAGRRVFHDNENGGDFIYRPQLGRFVEQRVDGEKWRIVWIASADGKYTIAVGQELEYREETALDIAEEFLYPWLGGLLVLLAASIWFIGREFVPLRRLAAGLERRSPKDLSPLDDVSLPREIKPLTSAINRLLGQVDDMVRREKSFIADSAHELRSPLTALKVQLEVLQLSQNDPGARHSAVAKMEQGIERCARLVEQLLMLSKLENATIPASEEKIDWRLLVETVIEEYRPLMEKKGQRFQCDVGERGPVEQGNSLLLSALLRNLIDNAVRYGLSPAQITLTIAVYRIEVVNTVARGTEQYLPRLGERFFRPAGQNENGSGLGLSIVEKIAALHGCKIEISADGGVFSVVVEPL